MTQVEFCDATTLVSASKDGTTRFWDVGSGAEQGQDAQGTHGEALAGERFAFSKRNSKEQVVGRFVVTAQGDFVRVYEVDEGVADKDVPGLFPGFVCMIFPDSSSVLIVLSTLVVRGKLEIRNPQKETILDLNHRKTAPQNSQLGTSQIQCKSVNTDIIWQLLYIIWIFHMAVTSYGYFIWQLVAV